MRTAREHKRKSGGRRRAVTALAAAALCAFAGILCLAGLEPPMDNADGAAPAAFFWPCKRQLRRLSDGRKMCGLCLGLCPAPFGGAGGRRGDLSGDKAHPRLRGARERGGAFPNARLLRPGLRQRLCAGVPIIAFVAIPNDTHYVVVVGYDADYLYLADSLAAEGAPYNRKLSIEEFERVWKTKTLLPDNIYIVINEK